MSLWKKISLGVLIFILLLLGTVAFLVGTTSGLHLLFKAANRWVPGLEIGQVTGGWRDLSLKNIRYDQPGVAVNAGEVHLAVGLNCLWNSSLCVNDLSLKDINVAIDSKKMPPSAPVEEEDSGPLNLSTPYPITLSRVALNNINIKIDDTTVSVLDFTSGLNWQEKTLTLKPTSLQGLLIALPKVAEVAQEEVVEPKIQNPQPDEKPLGETLKDLFSKPVLPEMTDVHLPLNLNIEEFRGEQLRVTGDTDLTVHNMLLKVSSIDGNMKLDALDIDSSQGTVNASGTAQLTDAWPVDITLNSTLNIDPLKGEKVKLKVGGALREQLEVGVNLSGPVDMDLRAQTRLAEAGLPLNLDVVSKQVYWPFTGDKQFQADDIKLKLTGKMTDYTLSMRTAVKGQDIPPATITLDAKGNEQQINLDKLTVAALEGKTELKALLDWQQAISWRGELTLDGINTAKELPDWPSKLNGLVKTRGSLYGGTWQMEVPELKLTGNVKQNKVNVNGSLKGNSYLQWTIPGLHLELGRNSAEVKGELGVKDLNLDAMIDAPGLDNALPGLGGTAKGLVKIRGTVEAPQLLADITARGLRWQELSVAQVRVEGDVKSAEQIAGSLNVRVERIVQPDVNINLVTLNAKGSEKQHELQLRIQGEPVSGQLDLAGSFDRKEQRWKGALSNTRFQTPVGPWSLNRAIALDYRNQEQKISIGPHCWNNPNAELCVPQTIDAGAEGRAVVNLNRFDLAMLKPFMPDTTQASGVFSGKADVSWDTTKEGLPQGKVTLSGRNVKVTQSVNDAPLPVAFETLNMTADLHNNRAELGWLIRLTNNGQFDGQVQVTDPQGRRNLGGNVNIRNFNLAMVNPIFSRGEKAAGMLNANLRLGGDVQSPQLLGQLQLSGLDIDGNFMPFDMQPSQLAINFTGSRSTIAGVVRTQQGQINLSGDADWTQIDNWRARIAAKGSRVRITVPPMVRLDVSPDVVFEATPSLFTLDGSVDVPWARIVVHDLPESAVGVSSDMVMLNNDLQPEKPQSAGIPINSNLIVHVGNNVRIDAFGLKARLTGDLKVAQDKQGLGLNGQINIPSGRFHAYGQDLIVRKGELLFSGPPDQPLLNIEAIRNPDATEDDVIAGVRVTGTADEPKAEIFSDPAMSQQMALSYLLRGQGLDSEQSDSAAMTSMLIGLGVAQSGQVVGKIGETFGVSNLALDTQGVGDSSQVVVSGYVLPGLQVKYGVGIFDSLATLTLRYRLMPKLYLEAVSGVDQALDLLYQFEF
ncbi:autotransporter assembly complex protein TamB [Citrobacter murliniae]|uniref:Autotransporter assembly complex protein TamB n=1 Tax=Citrobacter murliniae TaxID=67829 RepID=A0ABY2PZX4_9ENTR|nr:MULTISPECIES: autotransporter assembly complex protein TamB [Citrobacter]HEB0853917.1 autotransporter assembly complex protein TamB [Citrobacter freundii]KLV63700.1 translocation and assembly module TamB [Citrobacter sp. MGH106]MBJ9598723.1 autotransporter assembly complex protein TamB [Citrobacter werkmanii]MBJ9873946.1 autotransporter assembly complex protein TamB [Citrobacter werkmanii]THE40699.1 autotransporter assembly complex protein TamB [Citrobacter murliniae]